MTHKQLAKLRELRRRTEKRIEDAVRALYPIGARIYWTHQSGHTWQQHGTVIAHGTFETLKVRNHGTGRELWLKSWQIQ